MLHRAVREIEHVWIPMPDGVRLSARLWLPDENDIHVLAVAVDASADAIMTLNANRGKTLAGSRRDTDTRIGSTRVDDGPDQIKRRR